MFTYTNDFTYNFLCSQRPDANIKTSCFRALAPGLVLGIPALLAADALIP